MQGIAPAVDGRLIRGVKPMKALVYHGTKDLRYQDFPDPLVGTGEVLLRIKASGLCHTDFNEYINGPLYVASDPHKRTGRSIPLVLGHEFSGEVVELGPGVKRLRVGDRVAVNAVDACRECEFCRRGLFVHCPIAATIGFARDGGYAEYAAVPEDCCHVLRANVSFRAAAMVEPFSVSLHSVRRARVEVGSRAAIVGGGTIGLCTLQALRACGVMDVYVIERSSAKRKFAEDLGASAFIHSEIADPRQAILQLTGGMGADYTFECVGSSSALHTALSVTRPGGTVCLTGVISHPMEFNWNDLLRDEKTVTTTNAYNDEFPIVIAMLNDGRLKAEPLVSQTFPLKDAWSNLTRFEEAGRANIKMLIEMSH
jgi:(R,R)-butanediol dehydrogenase/meso-butanediol dehydrogenase/diacetyl reductase